MLLGSVVALSIVSCNSAEKVLYIQDAVPNQIETTAALQDIKVQPGDEIVIYVNCEDLDMSAEFSLMTVNQRYGQQSGKISATGSQVCQPYTVDANGNILMPKLGEVNIAGLTRKQICDKVRKEILDRNLLKGDVIVTVEFSNLTFATLGEVTNHGVFSINRDHVTLPEALAMSGDLTIYGRRDAVWVIREQLDGTRQTLKVDLRSTDFMDSPAYYIQQNDIIYVEPNSARIGQSSINENTFKSAGFWTSLTSIAISIATLVVTLTR
jgi:polysaccharide export outer membrane protein